MASILQTALELGLISSLTVLALFLSYSMLNVCDLSTDGCFTLGAVVGAVVALAGHAYLSLPAAMGAGMLSGLVTALLQTKMGIDSLLSGIIVNTGLYSINIAVMGGASLLHQHCCDGWGLPAEHEQDRDCFHQAQGAAEKHSHLRYL